MSNHQWRLSSRLNNVSPSPDKISKRTCEELKHFASTKRHAKAAQNVDRIDGAKAKIYDKVIESRLGKTINDKPKLIGRF